MDECLSPSLVSVALDAGYDESTCVRHRGWAGLKDWELIDKVIKEDFTLVTHNARDFRGTSENPQKGLHRHQELHAGLICINSFFEMDLDRQRQLFKIAINECLQYSDLINKALEITENEDGSICVDLYEIP
jgi:hypothetical protein